MKLKEICHSRTGDKGDISNVSLIPWNESDYELIKEKVTAEKVKDYFSEICHGKVTRYEVDGICALNFVMEEARKSIKFSVTGNGDITCLDLKKMVCIRCLFILVPAVALVGDQMASDCIKKVPRKVHSICLCMRQMQKQSADICRKVFQCVCPISLSHTKCIEIYHGWPDMGIMLQHLMYRLLIAAQMMK